MGKTKSYIVAGKVWKYPGPSGWFFVNLSKRESARIRNIPFAKTVGWGYVKVQAAIGSTKWDITLFPSKQGVYMIAIKANVRRKENIQVGDTVRIKIILDEFALLPLKN